MWTLEGFRSFHNTSILPCIEAIRKELLKARKTAFIVFACGESLTAILSVILFAYRCPPATLISIIAAIVSAAIAVGVYIFKHSQLNSAYKRQVVSATVKFIDQNLNYTPEAHIPEHVFSSSGLSTHSIDRFRGEDLVSGRYNGVEIAFSEIHAEYKTTHRRPKGGTRTDWHTIFKGVFFTADFNKDFKTRTIVMPDIAERNLGQLVGGFLQKMNPTKPGEIVKLENPEFERLFVVYSSDQVEARYILTPALMERIMTLKDKFGEGISMSFMASKVHITLPTRKNFFEMPPGASTSFDESRRLILDLFSIIGIVEDLNLETRIWIKS